jgi:hypothetical protein
LARRKNPRLPAAVSIRRYRTNFVAIVLIDRIVEFIVALVCHAWRETFVAARAAIYAAIVPA